MCHLVAFIFVRLFPIALEKMAAVCCWLNLEAMTRGRRHLQAESMNILARCGVQVRVAKPRVQVELQVFSVLVFNVKVRDTKDMFLINTVVFFITTVISESLGSYLGHRVVVEFEY